jgi:arsenical pump membrane protein
VAVIAISLLLVAIVGVLARPSRIPQWVIPAVCALIAIGTDASSIRDARRALGTLGAPIGFLLAAVPLAIALDRLGFFTQLADRLIITGRASGSLWILAALVTTVLNLDASVVLLTPLYIQIARQTGRHPLTLAAQPVLLACLASSALPVSNLTNLIAASDTGAGTVDFLTNLALPSLVATTVGWLIYRRVLSPDAIVSRPTKLEHRPGHPRALPIGGIVLAGVLIGFVVGPSIGLEPWIVALAADIALIAILGQAPWRDIPVGTAVIAASLGVLAAASVTHLPIDRLITGTSTLSLARTIGVTATGANLINNLPALLVALPTINHTVGPRLWAILIGVNMGPVILATGSLASLLWLDALNRLNVTVRPRDFTRIGLRVGLPAAAAGAGTLLVIHAITH